MSSELEHALLVAENELADAEEQGGRERIKAARRRVLRAAALLAEANGNGSAR